MNFDEIVNRYNTQSIKYDSISKRSMPEGVLPFWIADMDFKSPQVVIDRLHQRIDHGIFGYSDVDDSYNEIVLKWFKDNHQMELKAEWLFQTPGVVYAISLVVRSLTQKDDPVLTITPAYYPFFSVVEDNNREIVTSDLIEESGYYSLDYDDIETQIKEKKIKLVIFCNPHNPVGRAWKKEELSRLVEILKKYDCILVSDEIHMDFVYEPNHHESIVNCDPLWNQWIVCTSASKTFNLATLQLSNIIVSDCSIRNKLLEEKQKTGYDQPSIMGLVATKAAYELGLPWLIEVRRYIKSNYDYLCEYCQKHLPLVRVSPLEATYLVWIDFRAYGLNADVLNEKIVNEAGLWLDDGLMFGEKGRGFQRINIATPRTVLEKGLERLAAVFEQDDA